MSKNYDPIASTLMNDGFVIVPDSVFDEVLADLHKSGISIEHLYKQSEKSFVDIVDMTGGDTAKKFYTDLSEKSPKLYKR